MPKIIASFFLETRAFVIKRTGPGSWQELLDAVDDETRRACDPPSPTTYMDFQPVGQVLRVVDERLRDRIPQVIFELGKHNAEMNLHMTERILMKIITVKMVLRIASLLWGKRVRDGGVFDLQTTGPTSVKAYIRRFPVAHPQWFEYLRGWFVRTIEIAGGHNVSATLLHTPTRDFEDAEYAVEWR